NQPSYVDPGLEGPDYVALVIEWDEPIVLEELDNAVTIETKAVRPPVPDLFAPLAKGAAAIGAVVFALWGIHRLRAA
ncbi:MAG TPA: hypothetical protein VIU61_13995, partial [Kofleriaceae bacterium]